MANIAPPKLRRLSALIKLYSNFDESKQSLFYNYRQHLPNNRLKRKTPWEFEDTSFHLEIAWKNDWSLNSPINGNFVSDPTKQLPGFNWPRSLWTKLNRYRSERGKCNYLLHKWGMTEDPFCDCGQVHHIE